MLKIIFSKSGGGSLPATKLSTTHREANIPVPMAEVKKINLNCGSIAGLRRGLYLSPLSKATVSVSRSNFSVSGQTYLLRSGD